MTTCSFQATVGNDSLEVQEYRSSLLTKSVCWLQARAAHLMHTHVLCRPLLGSSGTVGRPLLLDLRSWAPPLVNDFLINLFCPGKNEVVRQGLNAG